MRSGTGLSYPPGGDGTGRFGAEDDAGSHRLSKNSLFCADCVSVVFLLLTDVSPLRAKIHRFLAGIKKILFLATLATPAPASQTRRSKVASPHDSRSVDFWKREAQKDRGRGCGAGVCVRDAQRHRSVVSAGRGWHGAVRGRGRRMIAPLEQKQPFLRRRRQRQRLPLRTSCFSPSVRTGVYCSLVRTVGVRPSPAPGPRSRSRLRMSSVMGTVAVPMASTSPLVVWIRRRLKRTCSRLTT